MKKSLIENFIFYVVLQVGLLQRSFKACSTRP